jgi:hypothetical protein
MSFTIDQVNKQFDDLQAAVTAEQARVTDDIAALKAQIAAGSPVTQAQLDAIGDRMTNIISAVSNFDINTPAPPVIPPSPPVAVAPDPTAGGPFPGVTG